MAHPWGNLKPVFKQKSAKEKWLEWAKAHQEIIAVAGIILLLLGVGIPYFLHNQEQNEKDSQDKLNIGQWYLHSAVDPKNGPFKSEVEKYQQCLNTFQRITTDYSGTRTAKLARFYSAKCQYSLGQFTQAYAGFEVSTQELKDIPLGDEAYLGRILCMEAQNQFPQAVTLAETFLTYHPDSFIAPEIRIKLSEIYLLKVNDKAKAIQQLKIVADTNADSQWGKEAARRLKDLQS